MARRRRKNVGGTGNEVLLLRQRGVIPVSTSVGASMISLAAPTGRGYRPLRARIQLSSSGTTTSLAQIDFLLGKADNSPLSTREVLLHSSTKLVRFSWPGNSPWCAESEYHQNLIELDNICLDKNSGVIYYVIQISIECSAPTFTASCPTINGQPRPSSGLSQVDDSLEII